MRKLFFFALITLVGIAITCPVYAATAAKATDTLTESDCIKCHNQEVKDVAANGAAHAEMECQDCHFEHPPLGDNTIPKCSLCHDPQENTHYTLDKCTGCHNPHHPLAIDFSELSNVKPACLSCHADKGKEMAEYPSAHSSQDCNECHTSHGLEKGQFLNCLDCHEGHSEDMVVTDCTKCHKAHSPKEVTYGEIPSKLCAGCHEDIVTQLANSKRLHSKMACSECHVDKHKTITPCRDCHGEPHGVMHKKYPKCIECHIDPHALAE